MNKLFKRLKHLFGKCKLGVPNHRHLRSGIHHLRPGDETVDWIHDQTCQNADRFRREHLCEPPAEVFGVDPALTEDYSAVITGTRAFITAHSNSLISMETLKRRLEDFHNVLIMSSEMSVHFVTSPEHRKVVEMMNNKDVDSLLDHLETEKDEIIIKDAQKWLMENVEKKCEKRKSIGEEVNKNV